jgi:hypothetical protein
MKSPLSDSGAHAAATRFRGGSLEPRVETAFRLYGSKEELLFDRAWKLPVGVPRDELNGRLLR